MPAVASLGDLGLKRLNRLFVLAPFWKPRKALSTASVVSLVGRALPVSRIAIAGWSEVRAEVVKS